MPTGYQIMALISESVKLYQYLDTGRQSSFCYRVINPFAVKFHSEQLNFRARVLQYVNSKQITVSYCFRVTFYLFASRCVLFIYFSTRRRNMSVDIKIPLVPYSRCATNQLHRKHNHIWISLGVGKQVVKSLAERWRNRMLLSCVRYG
jgi:hypothetical protein